MGLCIAGKGQAGQQAGRQCWSAAISAGFLPDVVGNEVMSVALNAIDVNH